MTEQTHVVVARMMPTTNESGRTMWQMMLADTVLEMLKETGGFTADALRERLLARMKDNADNKLLEMACLEAIEQLAARTIKL